MRKNKNPNCTIITTLFTAFVILLPINNDQNVFATGSSSSSSSVSTSSHEKKSGVHRTIAGQSTSGGDSYLRDIIFGSKSPNKNQNDKSLLTKSNIDASTTKQKQLRKSHNHTPFMRKILMDAETFVRTLFSHPDVDEALKEIHNKSKETQILQQTDRKKKRRRVKRTSTQVDSTAKTTPLDGIQKKHINDDDLKQFRNPTKDQFLETPENNKRIHEQINYGDNDDNPSTCQKQSSIPEQEVITSKQNEHLYKMDGNERIKTVGDEQPPTSSHSLMTNQNLNIDVKLPFGATNDDESTLPPAVAYLIQSIRQHFTSQRLVRLSLTCAQFGISYYLAKSIWTAICEVMEEIQQQEADMNGNQGFRGEDHDMPFLSEEAVDSFITAHAANIRDEMTSESSDPSSSSSSEGVDTDRHNDKDISEKNNDNPNNESIVNNNVKNKDIPNHDDTGKFSRNGGKRRGSSSSKQPKTTTTSAMTSNLALRLHASGLPLSSPPDDSSSMMKTVPNILKSLTRTEGQLLSNTLLSPIDTKEKGILMGGTDRLARVQEMWNEIGGLEEVKQSLWDLVFPLLMLRQPKNSNGAIHERDDRGDNYYGGLLSNPSGVLLYGPPGCGKTMLVRALAHTASARFLCVTPSTLFRKYVGETNLNIKALFSVAKKISPCIIFIDEMEGLFRERGGSSTGGDEHEVSRELKTEFMQLWDGIQTTDDNQILIVGATNRPFDVDSAFLRRMPRSFFVGLPNFATRISILHSMLLHVPKDDGLDISVLARVTEGYSPSDLKEVLRTAALFPLREARSAAMMERLQRIENRESVPITFGSMPPLRSLRMDDVLEAKDKVAPTLYTPTYKAALEEYAKRASAGRLDIFGTNKYSRQFQSTNNSLMTQSDFSEKTDNNFYNYPLGDNRFYTDVGTFMGDFGGTYRNVDNFQSDFSDETSEDYDEDDDDLSSSSDDSSFHFD